MYMRKSAVALFALLGALTACKTINKDPWLLTLAETQKKYPITLFARDFGAIPNDGKDDAKALRDAIAAAKTKDGGVRIVLGKGRYDMLSFDNGGAVPITDFAEATAKAIAQEKPSEASKIWRKQLGDRFPLLGEDDDKKKSDAAKLASVFIPMNPPKPWSY